MAELTYQHMSLYDLYHRIETLPEELKRDIGIFSYEFVQEYDRQVWEIQHNLNCNFLFTQVYDINNLLIQPAEIEMIDANNMKIYFGKPVRGLAKIMSKAV